MNSVCGSSFQEVYQDFITAQTAKGVSDTTIRNYHQVLHNISKYLDIEMPLASLSKSDLETMVVEMRSAGLALFQEVQDKTLNEDDSVWGQ